MIESKEEIILTKEEPKDKVDKDNAKLEYLASALKDWDQEVYENALEEIGNMDIKILINGLYSEESRIQKVAAAELGRRGTLEAANALSNRLVYGENDNVYIMDNMRDIYKVIVESLNKIDLPEAFDVLKDALYSKNRSICEITAAELGRRETLEAVEALTEAYETYYGFSTYNDKDEEQNEKKIREAIIYALGFIKLPEVVPTLKRALKDEETNVSISAVKALSINGTSEAKKVLVEALKTGENCVRREAVRILKYDIDVVIEAAEKDKDSIVREEAIKALKERSKDPRDSRIFDVLIKAFDDKYVLEKAIKGLGKWEDPRAIDILIKALIDTNNKDVQEIAIKELEKSKDPRAIEILEKLDKKPLLEQLIKEIKEGSSKEVNPEKEKKREKIIITGQVYGHPTSYGVAPCGGETFSFEYDGEWDKKKFTEAFQQWCNTPTEGTHNHNHYPRKSFWQPNIIFESGDKAGRVFDSAYIGEKDVDYLLSLIRMIKLYPEHKTKNMALLLKGYDPEKKAVCVEEKWIGYSGWVELKTIEDTIPSEKLNSLQILSCKTDRLNKMS